MSPTLTDDAAATLTIDAFTPPTTPAQLEALATVTSQLSTATPFISNLPSLTTAFSTLYFRSQLHTTTTISWSSRMTSCAGTCSLVLDPTSKRPKDPRECTIRLSEPLLRYRPRSDAVDTLLHELIHAYLFIAGGRHVRDDDPTGHGVGFQRLAAAINEHGGYGITTTHAFLDEVASYQTHVWQCTGSCKVLPPHFGIVRRAMNRPPGPSDSWYLQHQRQCVGGTWVKISEPPPKVGKKGKGAVQKNNLDKWVRKDSSKGSSQSARDTAQTGMKRAIILEDSNESQEAKGKRPKVKGEDDAVEMLVDCPVCPARLPERDINTHLDAIHGF